MSRRGRSGVPFTLFAFQDIITSVTGLMILVTIILMLDLIHKTEKSPTATTSNVANELSKAVAENEIEKQSLQARLAVNELVVGMTPQELTRRIRELENVQKFMSEHRDQTKNLLQTTEQNQKDAKTEASKQKLSVERLESLQKELADKRKELDNLKRRNRVVFHPAEGTRKQAWLVQLDGATVVTAQVGLIAPPQSFRGFDGFKRWLDKRSPQSEYCVLLIKPQGIHLFDEIQSELKKRGFEIGYDLIATEQTAIDPETGAGTR